VNEAVLKSLDEINFEDVALRSQQQLQTVSFEI